MNKAYLLVICLLLAPFTGCIEPEEIEITSDPVEDEDNSQVDETKDESDNNPIDFQPETRDELKTAVDEWIEDSDSANSTYGTIDTWDTSLITDMSELFYDEDKIGDERCLEELNHRKWCTIREYSPYRGR